MSPVPARAAQSGGHARPPPHKETRLCRRLRGESSRRRANQPLSALRRPLDANQPTRAVRPSLQRAPAALQVQPPAAPGGPQEPTLAPPRGSIAPPAKRQLVPLEPEDSPPIKSVRRIGPSAAKDGKAAAAWATSPPLYTAFARSADASRAKQLAAVLCREGATLEGETPGFFRGNSGQSPRPPPQVTFAILNVGGPVHLARLPRFACAAGPHWTAILVRSPRR